MGDAYRMLLEHKSTDEVFAHNFHSAEGWYSQAVFKAGLQVMIVGRGFDDYFREPVVVHEGRMTRCGLDGSMAHCIQNFTAPGGQEDNFSVRNMPPVSVRTVESSS